jgi:hypothetical protein
MTLVAIQTKGNLISSHVYPLDCSAPNISPVQLKARRARGQSAARDIQLSETEVIEDMHSDSSSSGPIVEVYCQ